VRHDLAAAVLLRGDLVETLLVEIDGDDRDAARAELRDRLRPQPAGRTGRDQHSLFSHL
jgi:hypothetical protein